MTPLILITTHQCPSRCSYCPILKRDSYLNNLIAFRAVDLYLRALSHSKGCIKLFGGEPFLRRSLVRDVVDYIRQKKHKIEIELVTNGINLDEEFLNWLQKCDVNLSISIDGDEETYLLNRKINRSAYKKIIRYAQKFSSKIIVNIVVAPNTVDRFYYNFNYLYNLGIRKFNILPAAYVTWGKEQLNILESQLSLVGLFIRGHPEIYIKNTDINNDIFFFNTGIVIDCDGDIYFSNVIMLKEFQAIKNNLRLGNINKMSSFRPLVKKAGKEIERIKSSIEKIFTPEKLKINKQLDLLLSNFVGAITASQGRRLDIKIGYQCNNHCLFCVQGDKRKRCAFRDRGEIEQDLIKAKKSCQSIVFTGGEPAIHPQFLQLVKFAKKLEFEVIQIQTNGRMFAYRSFCEDVIAAGANEFSPALHGHSPDLHDYLTTVKGSFNQTLQGIKNLKALGQRVITNTVVTKFNYRHLPEIARLFVLLGVDQFQFAFVHIAGKAWQNREIIVPKKSKAVAYIKEGLDIGIASGKKVMAEAIPYCFMQGYQQCVAERIIPESMVIEDKFIVQDYKKYRQSYGKTKELQCKRCLYFSICEGPWKEYPEMFGWHEFKAIVKKV